MIVNETLLRDALHSTSLEVTRHQAMHQRYGRGLITGLRTAWVAEGVSLLVADAILRNCLPENADPMCFPTGFTARTAPAGRFKVHEHTGGFEVEDLTTQRRHWLSDGVDVITTGDNLDFLSPGSPGFVEIWDVLLNEDEEETLQAYFPEQYALENPDDDGADEA